MDTFKLYTSAVPMHEDSYPWFHERIDFKLLELTSFKLDQTFEWCDYLARRTNHRRQTIMLDPGQVRRGSVTDTTWPATLEAIRQVVERIDGRADVWVLNAAVTPDAARRYAHAQRSLTPEWYDCAKISDDRFKILDNLYPGRVLPFYHLGDGDDRLCEVLEQSYYVAFSVPHTGWSQREREEWLIRSFQNFPGAHRAHAHDLGLNLLAHYPFLSADTDDVMRDAMAGFVRLDKNRVPVMLSEKSELRKIAGKHYDTMTLREREKIRELMEGFGFTIERLKESAIARAQVNLIEQNIFAHSFAPTLQSTQQTLF